MRRKIKHTKRYKDYPKNVPKKLLKEFFDSNLSVTKLAQSRNVNSGTISALLNDGKEPKDRSTRAKLYLTLRPVCPCCNRKIIQRKTAEKKQTPEYMKLWKKIPAAERQRAIEVYMSWRKK